MSLREEVVFRKVINMVGYGYLNYLEYIIGNLYNKKKLTRDKSSSF